MKDDLTIDFPQGILGFEDHTRFQIVHRKQNNAEIYWLQSLDNQGITMPLIDPAASGLNFSLNLSDEEQDLLQVEKEADLAVFLILAKNMGDQAAGQPAAIQANISGPIVINVQKRVGFQKIIYDMEFSLNIEEKS